MYTELNCKTGGQRQEPMVSDSVQALKTVWEDDRQRDDLCLDLQGPGQHFWAGAATFLLKVKSHRGEALNEMADAAEEHGRGKGEEEAAFTKASEVARSPFCPLSGEFRRYTLPRPTHPPPTLLPVLYLSQDVI